MEIYLYYKMVMYRWMLISSIHVMVVENMGSNPFITTKEQVAETTDAHRRMTGVDKGISSNLHVWV